MVFSGFNNRTPESREHTHMRTNQGEAEAEIWANRKSQRGTMGPRGSQRVVQGLVLKRRSACVKLKVCCVDDKMKLLKMFKQS